MTEKKKTLHHNTSIYLLCGESIYKHILILLKFTKIIGTYMILASQKLTVFENIDIYIIPPQCGRY